MKLIVKLILISFVIKPCLILAQWSYLGLGEKNVTKIEFYNNKIYAGTDSGLYSKSITDSDTSWVFLGLSGKRITDFLIFNTDTILTSTKASRYTNDTASLFITYNGGNNWNGFQNGFGGSEGFIGCSALEYIPLYSDTIYARAGACIAKSTDKGNTWQEVFLHWGVGGTYKHYLFEINPENPSTIWAGGESGYYQPYLLKSIDFGNNWEWILIDAGGDNICTSLLARPNNYDELLVGMSGGIIKSIDGGTIWNTVLYIDARIIDMEISPNNNDLIYVTGSKYWADSSFLFFLKSYDFGITWDSIHFLPGTRDYRLVDIEINKVGATDELFFATNKGIYKYFNNVTFVEGVIHQSNDSWSLHPNPITDYAKLCFNNSKHINHTLLIYDIRGRLVHQTTNIITDQVIINKNNLISGLYLFQLLTDEGLQATGKLIIE